jgi:hypothetical protein
LADGNISTRIGVLWRGRARPFGRPSAAAARKETWNVLGSLVRNLLLLPLNSLIENLSYPALLLFVLVLLGHSTGLIAPPS